MSAPMSWHASLTEVERVLSKGGMVGCSRSRRARSICFVGEDGVMLCFVNLVYERVVGWAKPGSRVRYG